ncbi:MAG TPA: NAD(P)/FAD-dependent oxidoreductase [Acidimicrobiales bacterium]|nr:NAD(P)/FAD-dependent oxidoreductase [Acidimicrobiales bacterium]
MTSQLVDVAVIGLGSAGEALSTALAEHGRHVVGFEPGRVGGECPFTACMPSKALLHDAVSGRSWEDARRHRDEVVDHLDDGSHADALQQAGVALVRSAARLIDEGVVEADGRRWRARHVVLATGSSPVVPPIAGIDDVPWLTSDELMVADELPESLLVLGGGAIGCEAATILAGFGKQVTIVESSALLGGSVDPAVADRLAVQLRDTGVEVCTDAELAEVSPASGGLRASLSTGATFDAATMLVATGQAPAWSELGLDQVGLDDEPDVDDEYRVGGLDWLRAIGDLNGRSPWTHGANHEARRLARMLVDEPPGPPTEHMAHCVFTAPPVAAIGLTAEAAHDEGRDVVVGTARYSDVARYSTDDLEDGIVVVVADRATGELLGCSGTGARFDDVIGIVAALLHCGCTVQGAAELVLPFPTIGQVLTPAFRDAADARS